MLTYSGSLSRAAATLRPPRKALRPIYIAPRLAREHLATTLLLYQPRRRYRFSNSCSLADARGTGTVRPEFTAHLNLECVRPPFAGQIAGRSHRVCGFIARQGTGQIIFDLGPRLAAVLLAELHADSGGAL